MCRDEGCKELAAVPNAQMPEGRIQERVSDLKEDVQGSASAWISPDLEKEFDIERKLREEYEHEPAADVQDDIAEQVREVVDPVVEEQPEVHIEQRIPFQ